MPDAYFKFMVTEALFKLFYVDINIKCRNIRDKNKVEATDNLVTLMEKNIIKCWQT